MLRRCICISSLGSTGLLRTSTFVATRWTRHKSSTARSTASTQILTPSTHPSNSYFPGTRRAITWAASILLVGHIFIGYVLDYAPCDGISMLPTFNSFGDAVLVSKYYRRGRGIGVGDVISYKHPVNPDIIGLKRVVGMEGDFVLRDTPGTGLDERDEKMIQVPQGHCWIIGDNLSYSRDSRMFGPLPMALIKGKAVYRFSPWWNVLAPYRLSGLSEPEPEDAID